MIEQIPALDEKNLPVVNKVLDELDKSKWTIRNLESTPTADSLNTGEIGIKDTSVYLKNSAGTLVTLTETSSNTSGISKGWAIWTVAGGTVTERDSYNVDSITDIEQGNFDVNWTIDFGSAYYAVCAFSTAPHTYPDAYAAGYIKVLTWSLDNTAKVDPNWISVISMGDQ